MTGVDSWSTTPATNATTDGGSVTWAEGQLPSTVNNSERQMMTDVRNYANDAQWFQYGSGDQGSGYLAVPYVYASPSSVTIAGVNVTTAHHVGRRMKFVGSTTGTIYGYINSSSFSTNTTINLTFDSGSLANETLTGYLSQAPVTGQPINITGVFNGASLANANAWSAQNTWTYSVNGPTNALTDNPAGTVSWAANTNQAPTLLMTGASNTRKLGNPTGLVAGGTYIMHVRQSSSGANALTFDTAYLFTGGSAPTLTSTANARDVLSFYSPDGTVVLVDSSLNYF